MTIPHRPFGTRGRGALKRGRIGLLSLLILSASAPGCRGTRDAAAERGIVRLLLRSLSLDSLCGCHDVVVDPIVRKTRRGFIAPPLDADTLLRLGSGDLALIRGARTITRRGIQEWPYFSRAPHDTLALAIYQVDSLPSASDKRFFALVVIPPDSSMRGWSWSAMRLLGVWQGGPLTLYYEP